MIKDNHNNTNSTFKGLNSHVNRVVAMLYIMVIGRWKFLFTKRGTEKYIKGTTSLSSSLATLSSKSSQTQMIRCYITVMPLALLKAFSSHSCQPWIGRSYPKRGKRRNSILGMPGKKATRACSSSPMHTHQDASATRDTEVGLWGLGLCGGLHVGRGELTLRFWILSLPCTCLLLSMTLLGNVEMVMQCAYCNDGD